jgi:DNA repair protein RadC
LAADPEMLAASLDGDPAPAAHIALLRASMLHALEADVLDQPVFPTTDALIDYLAVQMAHDRTETVRAIFLDVRNRLIRDEIVSKGSISQSQVNSREIVRRSLELGATALILAHNHPSGDPTPSRADIAGTRRLVALASEFDIVVHDHLIIARSGSASLRSLGLI